MEVSLINFDNSIYLQGKEINATIKLICNDNDDIKIISSIIVTILLSSNINHNLFVDQLNDELKNSEYFNLKNIINPYKLKENDLTFLTEPTEFSINESKSTKTVLIQHRLPESILFSYKGDNISIKYKIIVLIEYHKKSNIIYIPFQYLLTDMEEKLKISINNQSYNPFSPEFAEYCRYTACFYEKDEIFLKNFYNCIDKSIYPSTVSISSDNGMVANINFYKSQIRINDDLSGHIIFMNDHNFDKIKFVLFYQEIFNPILIYSHNINDVIVSEKTLHCLSLSNLTFCLPTFIKNPPSYNTSIFRIQWFLGITLYQCESSYMQTIQSHNTATIQNIVVHPKTSLTPVYCKIPISVTPLKCLMF